MQSAWMTMISEGYTMTDPVVRFNRVSMSLARPLLELLTQTSPSEFDAKFTAIEPTLMEWNDAFGGIDKTNEAQVDATIRIVDILMPLLTSVGEKSRELGATKGQKIFVAPAAGGKRRKMSRKYCKKTPCRKMGFTQRSSCRPYKNCFTRRR